MEELKNSNYHHFFKKHILITLINNVLLLIGLILGIYLSIKFDRVILSILLSISVISIIFMLSDKGILKSKVLVKISDQGIWLNNDNFILWQDIKTMRIDKVNLILSIFSDGEFDDLEIRFKNLERKKITMNIHGIRNRKTLVALADNYIEKHK